MMMCRERGVRVQTKQDRLFGKKFSKLDHGECEIDMCPTQKNSVMCADLERCSGRDLTPRIGIDSSQTHPRTFSLGDATLLALVTEVEVADENLELASPSQGAKPPGASKETRSSTLCRGPGEIRRTWVNHAERVVARLVKAEGDRVLREPSHRCISQSTIDSVDIELQRLLTNLYIVSHIP